MQQEQAQKEIELFLQELLASFGLSGNITFRQSSDNRTQVVLKVDEQQQFLIGKQGAVLEAIQQIANSIVRKNKSPIQYQIDINDYKEEKKRFLIDRVRDYIEEKAGDSSVLLWPMSSYERRVVHEYFLEQGEYITESENFGTKRVVRVTKK
jgi:predicted RNA-binding protein Jag